MGAYEDVRRDVWQQYQSATQQSTGRYDESLLPQVPSVEVSASQPAWLGPRWRGVVIVFSLLACAAALALTWWAVRHADDGNDAGGWAAGLSGGFAIIALVVAYLTVGGFGEAAFAIGSGKDQTTRRPTDQAVNQSTGNVEPAGQRRTEIHP